LVTTCESNCIVNKRETALKEWSFNPSSPSRAWPISAGHPTHKMPFRIVIPSTLKVAETIDFPPDVQLINSVMNKIIDRVDIMRIVFPFGCQWILTDTLLINKYLVKIMFTSSGEIITGYINR